MDMEAHKVSHEGKTLVWYSLTDKVIFPAPCVHVSRGQGDKNEIITVIEHVEWCMTEEEYDKKVEFAEVYDNGASHHYVLLKQDIVDSLVKENAEGLEKLLTINGWDKV